MKHIDSPGRLVLQDLPETIEEISGLHRSIEKVAYNFFTPQPVQGKYKYQSFSILGIANNPDQVQEPTSCKTSSTTGQQASPR
jgi:hypothetical protein